MTTTSVGKASIGASLVGVTFVDESSVDESTVDAVLVDVTFVDGLAAVRMDINFRLELAGGQRIPQRDILEQDMPRC